MKVYKTAVALKFPKEALPSGDLVYATKKAWKEIAFTKLTEHTNGALDVALVGENVTLCKTGDKVIIKENVNIPVYEIGENVEDYLLLVDEFSIAIVL